MKLSVLRPDGTIVDYIVDSQAAFDSIIEEEKMIEFKNQMIEAAALASEIFCEDYLERYAQEFHAKKGN